MEQSYKRWRIVGTVIKNKRNSGLGNASAVEIPLLSLKITYCTYRREIVLLDKKTNQQDKQYTYNVT
jgi:hypothetical protein